MKRLFTILTLFLVLPTSLRAEKEFVVHYDIALTSVALDGLTHTTQPIVTEPMTDLDGIQGFSYHYSDNMVNMAWYVSDVAFNYSIKNNTPLPMAVLTKDLRATDWTKRSLKMGYDLDGSKDTPVFTIKGTEFLSGFFIPRRNYPTKKGDTTIRPIIPNTYKTREEAQQRAQEWTGKVITLSLSVVERWTEKTNTRHRYDLTFEVKGVTGITEREVKKPAVKKGKARTEYVVRYDVRLDEVSCDRDVGYRQGITSETFTTLEGEEETRWRYADDIIGAAWYVSDIALNFSLVNKRKAAMTIPWSSVIFTDVDKKQSGVGYALERSEEMMPSFIPSGTGVSGFLVPDVNYPTDDDENILPLLPTQFRSKREADKTSKSLVGKPLRVRVPMMIGRGQATYYFTFVVDRVRSITKHRVNVMNAAVETTLANLQVTWTNDSLPSLPETLMETDIVMNREIERNKKTDSLVMKLRYLASYYNYFSRVCPQERVYLHLDNTAYYQGETIWYAAYVTDDAGIPEPASKILYVELLSPTGVILKQHKLKIVNGRCNGSFPLVDTSVKTAIDRRGATNLPSGYYQIRAYTHSMLNFDDAVMYSRVIPVYQFPKPEGHYDNPVVADYPYREIFRPEPKKEKKTEGLTISFYPEGGHLIEGITCNIAFKATNENGLGVNIDSLCADDGKRIPLSPQHRGMGRFEWLTQRGGEKLVAYADGRKHPCTLPKAEAQGCALHLTQQENKLVAHVDAVDMTSDSLLAFTLTSHGQLCAFDTLRVTAKNDTVYRRTNGGLSRQISKQVISNDIDVTTRYCPTGVAQFTLYNPAGKILAQRLVFIDKDLTTVPLTFTATKPEYKPFEQIQMTFRAPSLHNHTFSLAVRDAADYGTSYADDIRTYMLLSSELKGLIEDPGWYFEREQTSGRDYQTNRLQTSDNTVASEPNPKHSSGSMEVFQSDSLKKSALDLLMMVQGWTRYDWNRMAGVTPFEVRHYTEQQLIIEGWAFSRILERPLQNTKVDVLLVNPDRDLEQRATVTTDAEGYWSVGLEDFYGKWHLYYHTEQDKQIMKKATTRMKLERSYKPPLHPYAPIETFLPDPTVHNALLPSWREDISDFVMPRDAIQLQEVEITAGTLYVDYGTFHAYDAAAACEDIFDEGDYTYTLRDYLYRIGFYGDRYDATVYDHTVHRYIIPMVNGDSVLDNHNWRLQDEPTGADTGESIEPGSNDNTHEPEDNLVQQKIMKSDMEYIKSVMIYDTIAYDPRIIPSFKRFANRNMSNDMYQEFLRWLFRGDKFLLAEVDYGDAAFSERRGKNERLTTFAGYTPAVEFYAPTYPNGPVQGDKDYRRTLYWNPEVTTDETGTATVTFFNNGYSRALTVSAEGLTPDGIPILIK